MPTSTFNIAANVDDGFCEAKSGTPTFYYSKVDSNNQFAEVALYSGANIVRKTAWLRFAGITIPQGAVVNSALLKYYPIVIANTTTLLKIQCDSRQTPGIPTNAKAGAFPANVLGSAVTTSVTDTFTGYYPGTADFTVQNSSDVKALVQSLVDGYDYSNGEMVFYALHGAASATPAVQSIHIYNRDFGTTKAAELVIDYTEGSSRAPDKTTDTDNGDLICQ